jgi:N-methylhydantoinase A
VTGSPINSQPLRLAIDVGGTFTDIVVIDDRDRTLLFGKVLSTSDDPAQGSIAGSLTWSCRRARNSGPMSTAT